MSPSLPPSLPRYWHARYRPRRGWKRRQQAAKRAKAYAAYSGFGLFGGGGKEGGAKEEGMEAEVEEEGGGVIVDMDNLPLEQRRRKGKEGGREGEDEDEDEDALMEAAEEVGGREGVSNPGSRREAHRVAELDARLKDHTERIGAIEAHLLLRPENIRTWSVGESVRWALVAVALAEEAVEEVGRPVRKTEERLWRGEREMMKEQEEEEGRKEGSEGGGGEGLWNVVRKRVGVAVGEVGRRLSHGGRRQEGEEQLVVQQKEESEASSSSSSRDRSKKIEMVSNPLPPSPPPPPFSSSPSAPPSPITWSTLGPRAQGTLQHSLALRTRVAHHLEAHDLDRPKMNEWFALSLRAAAYIFFLRSLAEIWSRRESIHETATLTKKNTEEFLVYRFVEPGKAILDDLILNKRQRLTDVGAIADAQASLRRMLSDFIEDTYPKMSKEARKKALEAMDIGLVSEQYDKEIRHAVRNVFSGKIVRMLLIQMQYVKKELLVAMEAIDDLFNANKVNLQLFAVIPALFLTYFFYRAALYLLGALASRRISNLSGVHAALRRTLRDLERLLILAPRLPPSLLALPSLSPSLGGMGPKAAVLDERRLGEVVLLVAEFQNILRVNAPRLETSVRRALEEDMSDVLGGPGRQTVEQQLTSLSRIRRGYAFLQSRTSGGGSALFELLT
ncbi:hypothetical protein VYU27_010089 [Nannochloropsis oceanica]